VTDLAILVPSRGRPGNVARLTGACARTCRTRYVLHFGIDDDDPQLGGYDFGLAAATTGPRTGLVGWTNRLAAAHMDVPYLASLGDDMVPVTDGWDERLVTQVEHMGGGFAYPEDHRRNDIPEAVVVSTPVIAALGWFMYPELHHWYPDNIWADLGRGAGCLAYLPDVLVEHRHPNVDPATPADATYHEAAGRFDADAAAYRRWRLRHMTRDTATVRAATGRSC
jgi:hypothetical protein